jgi:hypothetical protein
MKYPVEVQEELFEKLIKSAALTEFGIDHSFLSIKTVEDFKKAVPVRSYEDFKPYIDRLRDGEQGVLWPSKLKWFAKSSGTTSGRSKYIPVTKEALEDCHYAGGKDLLALYYHQNPEAKLYSGKHLVMGGSSSINHYSKDCYTGDLSSIIIRNLPIWVELRRTPNREIALMDNWEEKIQRIAQLTMHEDVHLVAGVPSWTLVLFNRILELTGKKHMVDVWPNLEMFMHGGVSFKPYHQQFEQVIGKEGMHYVETYNASEGFFGIQDRMGSDDLLLMLDYGIFYEFMPMEEIDKPDPQTLSLEEVEINKNYALVISTNAGLWRYLIGDTVKFTSINPYRIQVSGRTKHFINVFGEELIVENAADAIQHASSATESRVTDYTVAPIFMENGDSGKHEWLIEFETEPESLEGFIKQLDLRLQELNSDYAAKRSANLTLSLPEVRILPKGTFYNWLKSKGKLGGQHKVPRLCNERKYADDILERISVV